MVPRSCLAITWPGKCERGHVLLCEPSIKGDKAAPVPSISDQPDLHSNNYSWTTARTINFPIEPARSNPDTRQVNSHLQSPLPLPCGHVAAGNSARSAALRDAHHAAAPPVQEIAELRTGRKYGICHNHPLLRPRRAARAAVVGHARRCSVDIQASAASQEAPLAPQELATAQDPPAGPANPPAASKGVPHSHTKQPLALPALRRHRRGRRHLRARCRQGAAGQRPEGPGAGGPRAPGRAHVD